MPDHQIVSREEWLAQRVKLLAEEKELTHRRDALSRHRRELPWVKIDDYVFEGRDGNVRLSELFRGKSQLIVFHLMFHPDWKAACKSCSFWADNFERIIVHLRGRDTNLVAVSRAPIAKIEAHRKRMGWTFEWVSCGADGQFNHDFLSHQRRHRQWRQQRQLRHRQVYDRRRAGVERLLQGRRRQPLPHLFDLLARARHAQRRLSPARHRAQGPR